MNFFDPKKNDTIKRNFLVTTGISLSFLVTTLGIGSLYFQSFFTKNLSQEDKKILSQEILEEMLSHKSEEEDKHYQLEKELSLSQDLLNETKEILIAQSAALDEVIEKKNELKKNLLYEISQRDQKIAELERNIENHSFLADRLKNKKKEISLREERLKEFEKKIHEQETLIAKLQEKLEESESSHSAEKSFYEEELKNLSLKALEFEKNLLEEQKQKSDLELAYRESLENLTSSYEKLKKDHEKQLFISLEQGKSIIEALEGYEKAEKKLQETLMKSEEQQAILEKKEYLLGTLQLELESLIHLQALTNYKLEEKENELRQKNEWISLAEDSRNQLEAIKEKKDLAYLEKNQLLEKEKENFLIYFEEKEKEILVQKEQKHLLQKRISQLENELLEEKNLSKSIASNLKNIRDSHQNKEQELQDYLALKEKEIFSYRKEIEALKNALTLLDESFHEKKNLSNLLKEHEEKNKALRDEITLLEKNFQKEKSHYISAQEELQLENQALLQVPNPPLSSLIATIENCAAKNHVNLKELEKDFLEKEALLHQNIRNLQQEKEEEIEKLKEVIAKLQTTAEQEKTFLTHSLGESEKKAKSIEITLKSYQEKTALLQQQLREEKIRCQNMHNELQNVIQARETDVPSAYRPLGRLISTIENCHTNGFVKGLQKELEKKNAVIDEQSKRIQLLENSIKTSITLHE